MVNEDDIFINESDYGKIKDVTVVNAEGKKLVFGVRDKKGITWQEKKKLANEYYDMDLDNRTASLNMEQGDMARYMAFIKYVKVDSGQIDMTKTSLMKIKPDVLAELEQHIPSTRDVLEGVSKSTKKK